ncbi:MAG: response regulator [Deltaproteobacteria bacterium]|nr:response regulator [Deltaproteobacteria bacterium]MBW2051047.1 response regulator [Deltaproteobacteria bacterium]MBW2140962.1 response regulator [Deltaproteobacteria bacterium]MBW2324629.1 response regulator [Deltaproteobacteria bacterium]
MVNLQLLLVDDEERFLETTQRLLEKRDIRTYTATNGLDALRLLDEYRIDVVILDVKMPGLDGVEVLRRIKQKKPLVEVIMLTGHASVESAVEGLKLGAFDYLMKPCDLSDLLEKAGEAHTKKQNMEEKIRKAKIEKIIEHPLSVFEKD